MFIRASLSKIQGHFKDLFKTPTVLKNYKFMKNTHLNVQNLLQDIGEIIVLKISIKLLCFYLVQHMLHQIKAQQFYTDLDSYQQC